MKAFLRILVLLQIIVLFIGCTNKEISPLLYKDEVDPNSSTTDVDKLNYTIDNVTLSKSYQSIEPNIEILKSGLDSKILLSLGIVESSGVTVDHIDKDGRDINIYIENERVLDHTELVVPQIILDFQDLAPKDLEYLNFKIINENYESIKTNIDIGEAINKIKSSLKIATSTFPSSNIEEVDGNILLDLNFTNVVDLKDIENPIIDLHVLINLMDGEIIKADKNPVSSLIDEGCILDYIPNEYIFYVKEVVEKDEINYDLWLYDIKKDSKEKIYTSTGKITSFKFNSMDDKAFFIKSLGDFNELYILAMKDLEIYKANLPKELNITSALWKNKDLFLTEDGNDTTNIYSLDIVNDELNLISSMDESIKQMQFLNDKFIFTVNDDKTQELYITENFKENTFIDRGEKPLFIDNDTIAYLKKDTNTDKDILWFYCLGDQVIKPFPNINVKDYFLWKDNLAIIEKTPIGSENPLYIYNIKDEETEFITSVKSDKIFLNTEENILYINSSIDLGENKSSVISFLNLENHKTPQELK